MNAKSFTQEESTSSPHLRPTLGGALQRKCACADSTSPHGSCNSCRTESLAGTSAFGKPTTFTPQQPLADSQQRASEAIRPAVGSATGSAAQDYQFGRIPVLPAGELPRSQPVDNSELPIADEQLEPDVDLAQALDPVGVEETDAAENTSCCRWASFEKSDDSYVDTATDCRKKIKFTFAVNSVELASDEKKCVMVNWIQGTAKNKDGSFRKVKMFGSIIDYNFPTMRIDSLDADPVYWSNATARWNYKPEGNGFFATDSPGPTTWVDGIDYDLKFKMCLHCIDDVATTSDAAGSGVKNPLKCIDWVFKAKFDAASGTFTH